MNNVKFDNIESFKNFCLKIEEVSKYEGAVAARAYLAKLICGLDSFEYHLLDAMKYESKIEHSNYFRYDMWAEILRSINSLLSENNVWWNTSAEQILDAALFYNIADDRKKYLKIIGWERNIKE